MALFNNEVFRFYKSSAMIQERHRLYIWLEKNEGALNFTERIEQRLRLNYALMYYTFEIRNDMPASICYFRKIEKILTDEAKDFKRVHLTWVTSYFILTGNMLMAYGSEKIKEALEAKDKDDGLKELKISEKKQLD